MPEEKGKEQEECLECRKKPKDGRWRDDFPVNWESDNYVTRRLAHATVATDQAGTTRQ